jgi:Cu(I)/Ag(I) efflux system protein CusF
MKLLILLIAALTIAPTLHAQSATPAAAEASAMSDGEVRKIDAPNGRITLKHGPIANLDMPGMTMVFRVQPPSLLKSVKVGDAVKFHAESINGALTVTAIHAVK